MLPLVLWIICKGRRRCLLNKETEEERVQAHGLPACHENSEETLLRQSVNALVNVVLSLIAMVIVLLLVSARYPERPAIDDSTRLLVSGAFVASCALGISLAFRPNWYKRKSSIRHDSVQLDDAGTPRALRGHHPDCESFEGHRIAFTGKTYCAGCLGISVGASLAIVMVIGYAVLAKDGIGGIAPAMTATGLAAIMLAFLETALLSKSPLAHVTSNASFIIGLFLVATGLLEHTGNGYVGLLGVLFAYLWTDTRIRLSGWRHSVICNRCSRACKVY